MKRRRSSTAEHSFQGIARHRHLPPASASEKCYPCVWYEMSPMSRAAHKRAGNERVGVGPLMYPAVGASRDNRATTGHRSLISREIFWRPRPELNRGTRFCRPLRNHSATWPHVGREDLARPGRAAKAELPPGSRPADQPGHRVARPPGHDHDRPVRDPAPAAAERVRAQLRRDRSDWCGALSVPAERPDASRWPPMRGPASWPIDSHGPAGPSIAAGSGSRRLAQAPSWPPVTMAATAR